LIFVEIIEGAGDVEGWDDGRNEIDGAGEKDGIEEGLTDDVGALM
jgi:hypothetical protein